MDDPDQAKQLIEAIREAKGLNNGAGDDEIRVDLVNALNIVSTELYNTPTHFILELIQNADDNRYNSDAMPTLTLIYRQDGYLWVGINELGFTEANVRAICRIAASTKKVENNRKGYIGEKGIGFKSVFKVADVVWVKSGALSFKFDTAKQLGMIAPEWADFHLNPVISERTMFCFRIPEPATLKDVNNRDLVENNLRQLKPELLLFLRQLRGIDIHIQDITGAVQHSRLLRRLDGEVAGVRHTTLRSEMSFPEKKEISEHFLVFQQTASDMPIEPKRPGVSESDVLIAFPIDADRKPILDNCDTFNFLPVRSYGLPFIVQGDFMLNASREDILQDNKWNSAVVAATIDLFISCVRIFNDKKLLQYTWLRYIKSQGNTSGSVFESFFSKLVARLRSCRILETQDLSLRKPSSLQTVPPLFTDGAVPPVPLLMPSKGLKEYVSASYDTTDLSELLIPTHTVDEFCRLLGHEALYHSSRFRGKSNEWHCRLADAILEIGVIRVYGFPLIPLKSGKWAPSTEKPLYFAELKSGLAVPRGIEVTMIDETAAGSASRRRLFTALGAETLSSTQVFQLILDQHASSQRAWDTEAVVKHALFLYNAPSRPRYCELSNLRVATRHGVLTNGKDLYMDLPGDDFQISEVFGKDNATVKFIHDDYVSFAPSESTASWFRWLQKELGVNTLPRLTASSPTQYSPEFQWLINNTASSMWLQLLRDNWDHYRAALTPKSVSDLLSNTPVGCTDGTSRELCHTWLKTEDITPEPLADETIPMVAVESPHDERWTKFSQLGLGTTPNLQFYLLILRRLPTLEQGPHASESIERVYKCIQEYGPADTMLTRAAFNDAALVYLAKPPPGQWFHVRQCRWKAPSTLKTIVSLVDIYPVFESLFTDVLNVKDADAADFVEELISLNGATDRIDHIRKLLIALSNHAFGSQRERDALVRITRGELKVFPVRDETGTISLRSARDLSWFVADSYRLHQTFDGKLPLLSLRSSAIEKLKGIWRLESRMLSKRAIERSEATGETAFEFGLTESVKAKAKYVACLVDQSRRLATLERLMAIEIWSSKNIVLRWRVLVDGKPVFGTSESGWAVFREVEGRLQVYVPTGEVTIPHGPLSDRLMSDYGISSKKESLLLRILATNNVAMMEDMLEREGLLPAPEILSQDDLALTAQDATLPDTSGIARPVPLQTITSRSRNEVHTNGMTRPKSVKSSRPTTIDDSDRIVRAARSLRPNAIGVVGNSTRSADMGGRRSGASSSFDMTTLSSSLSRVNGRDRDSGHGTGASTRPSSSVVPAPENTEEWQLQIGYGGELLIFNYLKSTFQAGDDSWTSSVRARAGLPAFEGDEAEYADFTIDDPEVCQHITTWLTDSDALNTSRTLSDDVKYHIECKTTVAGREEAFSMSSNQVAMAEKWHESITDVYIILRVHNFRTSPEICAYVDPWALRLEGKLSFTTQGSYYVKPT